MDQTTAVIEHSTIRLVFILNTLPWYTRLPTKWAILGLTVFLVCFPYPNLFVRHVRHWRDPNALIEPDAPALQPWVAELRAALPADLSPPETLRSVEQFVYEKVPYEWDWNTWGQSDYLPTVTELIEMGKEDCDGRAVIAASLLQNFGFKAQIVTDFAHVWVKTDQGELMGPGRRKAVVATDRGLQFHWRALVGLPQATVYGIAVFPLIRELIVLIVAWWLLLRTNARITRNVLAIVLLSTGLLILRRGSSEYLKPVEWMQIVGVLAMATAVVVLHVSNRRLTQTGPIAAGPL
jgi:hypothetical protein